MQQGAIILCGGRSERMGRDKALLPFGPDEVLLQRVVRIVSLAVPVSQIAVVAAKGQQLPKLPRELHLVTDRKPGRGPLEGLAVGLASLQTSTDRCFVTTCDAPLLVPAVIEKLFALLANYDAVIPSEKDHLHPLTAVYKTSLLPVVEELLAKENYRVRSLAAMCNARFIETETFRDFDESLGTFKNCNHHSDYLCALAECGFTTSIQKT